MTNGNMKMTISCSCGPFLNMNLISKQIVLQSYHNYFNLGISMYNSTSWFFFFLFIFFFITYSFKNTLKKMFRMSGTVFFAPTLKEVSQNTKSTLFSARLHAEVSKKTLLLYYVAIFYVLYYTK